jgi:type IV pilus assembly protein PilQ
MKIRFVFFAFVVLMSLSIRAQGQTRLDSISRSFIDIGNDAPGLDDYVDITLTNSTLQSFLSGMGKAHRLNIIVDPGIDQTISVNFTNEKVSNILIFVCQKYDLGIQFTGAIMSFYKIKHEIFTKPKQASITQNADSTITLDLKADTLSDVVKQLIIITNTNITLDPEVRNKLVNAYIQGENLSGVLQKIASGNNLELFKNKDGSYNIEPDRSGGGINAVSGSNSFPNAGSTQPKTTSVNKKSKYLNIPFKIEKGVNSTSYLSFDVINQSLSDVIKSASENLGINYVFQTDILGTVTLSLNRVTYDQLLSILFKSTLYSYKKEGNIYVFGERPKEGIRESKVVSLQFRSVKDVTEAIPKEIGQGIQIYPFPELNSIILSGSSINIQEVESFIKSIDKPVPVITIEIMILDVKKSHDVSAGLKAGIGQSPPTQGGTILPGVDFTVGSGTINDILDKIGLTSLGKLLPSFYLGIKALETNGYLDIQSTPKLATLNGHKASLNIGETSYYQEQNQNVVGVQNPQTIVTTVYKPVNADFTIDIEPTVSGNDNVTLTIKVNQSDFTQRVSQNGPPGTSNRKFESIIRVKNEEVVLLGGLEKTTRSDSGTGLPLLARVPFLKWIFGTRDKSKAKDKLLILIKPTIQY